MISMENNIKKEEKKTISQIESIAMAKACGVLGICFLQLCEMSSKLRKNGDIQRALHISNNKCIAMYPLHFNIDPIHKII